MRNIVISGSASGIGLACKEKLESLGDRVIGIDIRDADIVPDLSTPDGRRGTAAEMAGVIAFMLSEDAAYIHGMMMWVDGGTDAAIRPDRF